jgi:hypothetical protein
MVGSVSSFEFQSSEARADEINKIQLAVENDLVRAKLKAYGLTSEEIEMKLQDMTDKQINPLVQASDNVLGGGDGIGFVIGILKEVPLHSPPWKCVFENGRSWQSRRALPKGP